MMIKLAFKNLLRNKKRSLLSGFAIFIAAFVVTVIFAFEQGMITDILENTKAHVTGDIQIRTKLYNEYERVLPLQYSITKVDELKTEILKQSGVERIETLSSYPVMIYKEESLETATATGLDLSLTKYFENKKFTLLEGTLLKEGTKEVLITSKFQEKLGLSVGDKFTFITKTANQSSNGSTFHIVGVGDFSDSDLNTSQFFVDNETLMKVAHLEDSALSLLVFAKPKTSLTTLQKTLKNSIDNKDLLDIRVWDEVSLIYQFYKVMDLMYFLFCLFFFVLAATTIFNTMMISTIERKKEIATLKALGYSQRTILNLFLSENAILGFIATTIGLILGFIVNQVLFTIGLDMALMGGDAIKGMSLSNMVYPQMGFQYYLLILISGVFICLLAALFPVKKGIKTEVATALRTTL